MVVRAHAERAKGMPVRLRVIVYRMLIGWLALLALSWPLITVAEPAIVEVYESVSTAVRGGAVPRQFDESGIVHVGSARIGSMITSPFYVVHYGLRYTHDLYGERPGWIQDPVLSDWPYPPPKALINIASIVNVADWVCRQARTDRVAQGNTHLYYEFAWHYRNIDPDHLTPPWWSGLTDAIAIEFLMRAHDLTGKGEYKDLAAQLYRSTLQSVESGGSTVYAKGSPVYIEEYVDPSGRVRSGVLNGALCAGMYIWNYERRMGIAGGVGLALCRSALAGLHRYDLGNGRWSYYDEVGTIANLKYQRINAAMVAWVGGDLDDGVAMALAEKWRSSTVNPILRAVWQRHFSPYYLCVALAWVLLPAVLVIGSTIVIRSCRHYFVAVGE